MWNGLQVFQTALSAEDNFNALYHTGSKKTYYAANSFERLVDYTAQTGNITVSLPHPNRPSKYHVTKECQDNYIPVQSLL
jgi:hypothetical protein